MSVRFRLMDVVYMIINHMIINRSDLAKSLGEDINGPTSLK